MIDVHEQGAPQKTSVIARPVRKLVVAIRFPLKSLSLFHEYFRLKT